MQKVFLYLMKKLVTDTIIVSLEHQKATQLYTGTKNSSFEQRSKSNDTISTYKTSLESVLHQEPPKNNSMVSQISV